MALNLGTITVLLSAETSKFRAGIQAAAEEIEKTKKRFEDVTTAAKPLAVAGSAAFAAIALEARKAVTTLVDYGEQVDKLVKSTGAAAETIERLGYAAQQEHASMEALSTGLLYLSRQMAEAASGSEAAQEAFARIGVSVTDTAGNLRRADEVLLDVADRFASTQSEALKAQTAFDLFSRSGRELIPFLSQGRGEIERLGKEAERIGIVLSGDAVRAAEAMGDQLDMLSSSVRAAHMALGQALMPTISSIVDALAKALNAVTQWVREHPKLVEALTIIAASFSGAAAAVGGLTLAIPALSAAFAAIMSPLGLLSLALGALVSAGILVYKNWDTIKYYAQQAWSAIKVAVLTSVDAILAGLEKFLGWIPGLGAKLKTARESVKALISEEVVAATERNAKREADIVAEQSKRALMARWGAYQQLVGGAGGGGGGAGQTQEAKAFADAMKALNEELNSAVQLEKLLGDQFDLNEAKASALRKAIEALVSLGYTEQNKTLAELVERYKAVQKEIEKSSIAAVYADLNKELERAKSLSSLLGGEYDELAMSADAFRKAIEALIALGLDPQSAAVQQLIDKYTQLRAALVSAQSSLAAFLEGKVPARSQAQWRMIEERSVVEYVQALIDAGRRHREELAKGVGVAGGLADRTLFEGLTEADLRAARSIAEEAMGPEAWKAALAESQVNMAAFVAGEVAPRNAAQLRMFDEKVIAAYLQDREAEWRAFVDNSRRRVDAIRQGVEEVISIADGKLIEYSVTVEDARKVAESVLSQQVDEAKARWQDTLDELTLVFIEVNKHMKGLAEGTAPARSLGDRLMLEASASVDEALKAVEESSRIIWQEFLDSLTIPLLEASQYEARVRAGEAAPLSAVHRNILEYLVSPEEGRRAAEEGMARFAEDERREFELLVANARARVDAIRQGIASVFEIADGKLLEYSVSVEEAQRIAEEVLSQQASEAADKWQDTLHGLAVALLNVNAHIERLRAGFDAPGGLGERMMLEATASVEEGKRAADEGMARYLATEAQLLRDHMEAVRNGVASVFEIADGKILEYSVSVEEATRAAEGALSAQADEAAQRWQDTLHSLAAELLSVSAHIEALKAGIEAPRGLGDRLMLEAAASVEEGLRAAEEGTARYIKEVVEEVIRDTFFAVRAAYKHLAGLTAGTEAAVSLADFKVLEYASAGAGWQEAAIQGYRQWRDEVARGTQRLIALADSFTGGLASGLEEAGTAWGEFMSVVVSSIVLATDEAGQIIGIDWKQTLVNIADYGLRTLGQALGTLFGGAARLARQYPGGAYGVVNYPDLARMRENYENWQENFEALRRAQQAQAGMTVGGGLIGGVIGFLVGGPLGALIGAGLGAGVGHAAGQATYGQQIEDLKKRLEDTFQKIAETLGTAISNVADALGSAFSADTYSEFLTGFATNLEAVVKQALIKAFMAGEAMRPLLQGLSDFITAAVWDGVLTAEEKLQLVAKFQEILGVAAPFWEALQQFDFVEAVGGATEALNEFSEALRNVPTGWKVQSARWEAALPAYQEGGVVGRTGVALLHAGERVIPAGEASGIHIHLEGATFYGNDDFERVVVQAVSRAAKRAGLTRYGVAAGVS